MLASKGCVIFNQTPNCTGNNKGTKQNQLTQTAFVTWEDQMNHESFSRIVITNNYETEGAIGDLYLSDLSCNPVSVRAIMKAPNVTSWHLSLGRIE